MSWLERAKSTSRRKGKNFTHGAANKRIKEALPVVRDQIKNALSVNSAEAIVMKAMETGKPCMCRVTLGDKITTADQESNPDAYDIEIDDAAMFGEDSDKVDSIIMEAGDMLAGRGSDEEDEEIHERPIDNAVKCGICYRTGYTPPFEAVGYSFYSMDASDIEHVEAYSYSQSDVPTKMIRTHESGFVMFSIAVPQYFKTCKASVRDNLLVTTDLPKVKRNGKFVELDMQALNESRGDYLDIYVDVESFTHVTMLFSMGADPILVNLGEEANAIDFMTMSTIGNMQVVLPHNIGWVKPRDMIYIPSRNLVLKITDAPKKQTVDQEVWEWAVTTRVLQPNEDLNLIMKGRDIY